MSHPTSSSSSPQSAATQNRRRALVTGGTSGIGAAIARRLADDGCDVVATGLTADEVRAFSCDGPQLSARTLNVTDLESIRELVDSLAQLDVLVNCAGTVLRGGREHDPVDFARVIDVNLNGTMRMCAACRPLLAAQGGCVLNLASMLSFFGSGHVPAYSASKGGVAQLTKSLAIAWADDRIRVNAIAPGWIETPLTAPLVANDERRREIIARTPLRRWGRPEDVAGAAVFLCSAAAAFITGAILPVDGGYSIA